MSSFSVFSVFTSGLRVSFHMTGPWLWLCFLLESLCFPLFLTTFSACWCQSHISLNFHLWTSKMVSVLTILTTSCAQADQVASQVPKVAVCGSRLRLLLCMQCSWSLSQSLPRLWCFFKSGFVPQLLSSPMAAACLCPCKDDPWSCWLVSVLHPSLCS